MNISHVIILSRDLDFIELCKDLSQEVGMEIVHKPDVANLLLSLQENDYQVVLYDCLHADLESLKWIKLIKKIRPKVPLIISSNDFNKQVGARMYEQGAFYLCIKPVHKEVLRTVLSAAITHFRSVVIY